MQLLSPHFSDSAEYFFKELGVFELHHTQADTHLSTMLISVADGRKEMSWSQTKGQIEK